MAGKIALEEHFAIAETVEATAIFVPQSHWPELKGRFLDAGERRLAEMDANGIDMMILSLNGPGVQAVTDTQEAVDLAQRANDHLAEVVARRPDRFQGFAALPMLDPEPAARELERCIIELGFRGALVNGFSQLGEDPAPIFYDIERYRPFWAMAEALSAPFYLHPRNPAKHLSAAYEDHPWLLGPYWAFAQETAVHALRLMCSGLFDAHPRLSIVLGHLGEGLPFHIWRCDHRNSILGMKADYPAVHTLQHYLSHNFFLTCSGNFSTPAFLTAIMEMGSDRIMFSVDWPYEEMSEAIAWLESTPIAPADRQKIERDNAISLFKLGGIDRAW